MKSALSLLLCLALSAGFAVLPAGAESAADGFPPVEEEIEMEEVLPQEAETDESGIVPMERVEPEEKTENDHIPDDAVEIETAREQETPDIAASQAEYQAAGYETRLLGPGDEKHVSVAWGDDYAIRMDVPEEAFAEDVVLFAAIHSWEALSESDRLTLEAEGITPASAPVLFDIGFADAAGAEVEPAVPVSMVIEARAELKGSAAGGLSIQAEPQSLDGSGDTETSPQIEPAFDEIVVEVYHINHSGSHSGGTALEVVASSDESRLTVETRGEGAGTVVIEGGVATATIEAGSFSTYVLRINNNRTASVMYDTIKLNPRSSVILRVYDDGNNEITSGVTWQSSKTGVATVSSYGLLRCVGTGSATITAAVNGDTVSCNVVCTNSQTYALYDSAKEALVFFSYNGTPAAGTQVGYGNQLYTASEIFSNFETVSWVPWSSHNATIRTVAFATVVSPSCMDNWFSGCYELTDVYGADWVNTSNVTSMYRMFFDCRKLTSLDLHTWDTSRVTNMGGMFYGCSSLTSLNLSDWYTAYVTDMSYMFCNCKALPSLDVSSFNTYNVLNMAMMFSSCHALTALNLRNFYTVNVTNMAGMFSDCPVLRTIRMESSSFFVTPSVTDMSTMFNGCTALETIEGNLSNFDTGNVTDMSLMFSGCNKLDNIDVSGWNVEAVTNMSSMFSQCLALTTLDVSGWRPRKVESMAYMFYQCGALTSVDLHGWYPSKLTNASGMFHGCTALTQVDARMFARPALKNVSYMFYLCSGLKALHLGGWTVTGIEDWSYAFGGGTVQQTEHGFLCHADRRE